MNTITVTPALMQWIEKARETRASFMQHKIADASDPKVQDLIRAGKLPFTEDRIQSLLDDPEMAGFVEHECFRLLVDLPAPPLVFPRWAETISVGTGVWPEVTVRCESKHVVCGDSVAYWSQYFTVVVEDDEWPDGSRVDLAGTVATGGPSFALQVGGKSIDFEEADVLDVTMIGELILDAARLIELGNRELRRITEPGPPHHDEEGAWNLAVNADKIGADA
ncbi:hypothetical protein ACR5KS_03545 [Leucobacter sp. W1153]|uniref:hypothetical protein n=1 Tax=Leucobacter sp. W1153 TaxID=3439064 RepID=UPI003F30ED53